MAVFELVKETSEQIIVKVNAKDTLTVAEHPYVNAKMEYITVTRGDDNIYTIVYEGGTTWSWHSGKRGCTLVSENVNRLRKELCEFLTREHVFLGVHTELNPYAASFYATSSNPHGLRVNDWWVDFEFCDTDEKARAYFDRGLYPTPEELAERCFSKYNELFKKHGEITETPNQYVGTVYRVEIGDEF